MKAAFQAAADTVTNGKSGREVKVVYAIHVLLPALRLLLAKTSRLRWIYRVGLKALIGALEGYQMNNESAKKALEAEGLI